MSEAELKNIIVCMKQVLDPEIPISLFRIDPEARIAIPPKNWFQNDLASRRKQIRQQPKARNAS